MTTVTKDEVFKELTGLSDDLVYEIFDFIKIQKKKGTVDQIKSHLASEHILSKDWLSKEEEDAWKNLKMAVKPNQ